MCGVKKLGFQKMLVLATSHVSDSTRHVLDGDHPDFDGGTGPFNVLPWESYGWIVWADPEELPNPKRFPEMEAIRKLARDNGCQWIRFDCDAAEVEGLPTHEWTDDVALVAVDEPHARWRVELRAPRAGERGWWVLDASSPETALAEVEREGGIDDEGSPGWEASHDYAWAPDSENMWPVTLVEVAS